MSALISRGARLAGLLLRGRRDAVPFDVDRSLTLLPATVSARPARLRRRVDGGWIVTL